MPRKTPRWSTQWDREAIALIPNTVPMQTIVEILDLSRATIYKERARAGVPACGVPPYGKFEKRPLLATAIKTSEDLPFAQLARLFDVSMTFVYRLYNEPEPLPVIPAPATPQMPYEEPYILPEIPEAWEKVDPLPEGLYTLGQAQILLGMESDLIALVARDLDARQERGGTWVYSIDDLVAIEAAITKDRPHWESALRNERQEFWNMVPDDDH